MKVFFEVFSFYGLAMQFFQKNIVEKAACKMLLKMAADVKLDEDELFIGKVIIHIFQLLRYNAHGILEQVTPFSIDNLNYYK